MARPSPLSLAIAALATVSVAGACASAVRATPAPIDPGVLETVRAQDSVAVVVLLVPPEGADPEARQSDILRMQDSVLDALEPGEFRLGRRLVEVPALTLVVYGERALRTLARQEHVERIGLDDGGGMGGAR